jgi:hypothetical protein
MTRSRHYYLSLLFDETTVRGVVRRIRTATITIKKATDLLRASRLGVLPLDDHELVRDLEISRKGAALTGAAGARWPRRRSPAHDC